MNEHDRVMAILYIVFAKNECSKRTINRKARCIVMLFGELVRFSVGHEEVFGGFCYGL